MRRTLLAGVGCGLAAAAGLSAALSLGACSKATAAGSQRAAAPGQAGMMQGPTQGAPAAPGMGGRANYADELTDFGVQPKSTMERNVGTPTPLSIPGGHLITTAEVKQAIGSDIAIVDVLSGPHPTLPRASTAPGAGMGGSFDDAMQAQFGQFLARATKGNKAAPVIIYCASSKCWESYNAALRAIRLGYKTVLWYRGGLAAWRAAGGPMTQSGGDGGPGQGQGYPGQGYPGQGMPQGYPGQGGPGQGMPQGYPGQGYPQQGMPQGYPGQGYPQQGMPQGYPGQGYPQQGYPGQGMPQGYPQQGMPQGYPQQQGPGSPY